MAEVAGHVPAAVADPAADVADVVADRWRTEMADPAALAAPVVEVVEAVEAGIALQQSEEEPAHDQQPECKTPNEPTAARRWPSPT